jgi:hypothetical protein
MHVGRYASYAYDTRIGWHSAGVTRSCVETSVSAAVETYVPSVRSSCVQAGETGVWTGPRVQGSSSVDNSGIDAAQSVDRDQGWGLFEAGHGSKTATDESSPAAHEHFILVRSV